MWPNLSNEYSAPTAAWTLSPKQARNIMSPTWVGILGDVAPTVMNGILAALEGRAGGEHGVGVRVADHQRDLVLLDELLRRLGGDVHLVLAVVDDEVDLASR